MFSRCEVFNKWSERPLRWETGRCILDMKDFMKEIVNAPSPHGFLCRFGPCILVEVEFQRGMEAAKPEYCEGIPSQASLPHSKEHQSCGYGHSTPGE